MIVRAFNNALRRHTKDESGASLIEYTVVISLFLLMFFAILDFGRLGFNWVMTEKAMQRAARIATVRPAVCPGVPDTIALQAGSSSNFGTLCRVAGTCVDPGVQQCVLGNYTAAQIDCVNFTFPTAGGTATPSEETAAEIWCTLEPILPHNSSPRNIYLRYAYTDPANNLTIPIGFAGGPYSPYVEVGVVTADNVAGGSNVIANAQELRFEFLTPIPGLAVLAGGNSPGNIAAAGTGTATMPSIAYPDLSVSLPGEDLNTGDNG